MFQSPTMSFHLPARGNCLLCPCKNTYFYEDGYDDSKPRAYSDLCVCQHPYTTHRLSHAPDPEHPHPSRIKGANVMSDCGGFLAAIHPPWVPPTICVGCMHPWFHHEDPEPSAVLTTAPGHSATLPLPPPSSGSLPIPRGPQPPPRHHALPPPREYISFQPANTSYG
ncbi:hypothetical protein DFH08DRAFT_102356 [Mycena albidolilacea]|uniref:Uncharacterized protein n=1 Tax=Mycena albidolilacea TaxID=1033008 RepID=A0AAD7E842_9AGAR|nr:hypothetical protein DFH08DRAFT_102356 [Mycena albidolilacea]